MLVHQILSSKGGGPVLCVRPETKISEVAQLLTERRIGGVIVSKNDSSISGILSERDIVRSLAVRGGGCLDETAEELMTRNPVCCVKSDTADAILKMMTDGRFRHMPVIDDGELIGIVTIGDVVKARLQELSMEKEALEGMIMGH